MITQRSIRRHLLAGGAAAALLAGGVGGWAATTELAGAVIAPGQLVVDSNVKKVQHPTGGVVGELRVKEGDRVKAGDVVVRLDDTQVRSNLAIVTKALDELAARQARGEAERDGAETVSFPADLLARLDDPEVRRVTTGEQKLFEIRRGARQGQKAQLQEQIAQLGQQVQGNVEQEAAKVKEIDWIQQELKGVRDLWKQNLAPFNRLTTLERDAARLEGERGALIASAAQARGRIAETELKILQIDEDLRTDVDPGGRGRDADRARRRQPHHRGQDPAARDRPGPYGAAGRAALHRVQPAHHARAQRRGRAHRRRRHAGGEEERELLRRAHPRRRRRAGAPDQIAKAFKGR